MTQEHDIRGAAGECRREFGVRQGKPISRFLEGRKDTGRG